MPVSNSSPASRRRIRIVHIITGLGLGGTEALLYKVLSSMDRTRFENHVISLSGVGEFGEKIAALGIPVWSPGGSHWWSGPAVFARTIAAVRRARPDIVQTWLHHADLMGTFAAPLAGNPAMIWTLQCARLTIDDVSRSNLVLVKILSWLSKRPDVVASVSEAGRTAHADAGYRPKRWAVIPNCVDASLFAPDQGARRRVRAGLGITDDVKLIGLVGRYHPMKGHALFIDAASRVVRERQDAVFLMAGSGVDDKNPALREQIDRLGLAGRVRPLGIWADLPAFINALDVYTIASTSEGFPTVLAEAMSCGVPCVSTDVGDCALVIDGTGRVVPVGDAAAMAAAWGELLDMPDEARRALGRAARERVEQHYDVSAVVSRYESLYESVVRG